MQSSGRLELDSLKDFEEQLFQKAQQSWLVLSKISSLLDDHKEADPELGFMDPELIMIGERRVLYTPPISQPPANQSALRKGQSKAGLGGLSSGSKRKIPGSCDENISSSLKRRKSVNFDDETPIIIFEKRPSPLDIFNPFLADGLPMCGWQGKAVDNLTGRDQI